MAGKTTKKFRSKWLRVAVEGATSDKRVIKRSWLEQAAKNFNPNTYGARIWLEHFRSLLPDGPFKAYGDVLAAKAEEVTVDGKKKLALFVQIEPSDDLVALNKAKQKIYTSVELDESFADSGEAYLVGLAVTDSPASLGTDMLAFCAEKPDSSPFKDRHYSATSMFSEAVEAELEFEEVDDTPSQFAALFGKVSELLTRNKAKTTTDDARFADMGQAVEVLAEHASEQSTAFSQLQATTAAQAGAITVLTAQVAAFNAEQARFAELLNKTPDGQPKRPAATGQEGGAAVTDC
ncbi:MAG: GPO family capsid scaffolding protein [Pseudomonas sp.]|uniref:GPO family capsid scaffolding protein n=1 Tax=Pseudomonas sp. TaxID=306 RepID=UPI003396C507